MRVLQLGVIFVFVLIIFYLFYIHFGKDIEKSLKKDLDPLTSDPCVFLENDIATDNVFNEFGEKITKNKKIDCSQCGQYVYKGPDGCSPYQKDFLYSVRDKDSGDNLGICTSLSFPRECKFKSKNPPQNQ